LKLKPPPQLRVWEQVSSRGQASWYLDPLVAEQKKIMNARLLDESPAVAANLALKTDSFEEAFGDDTPLNEILPFAARWLVMDVSVGIVQSARARFAGRAVSFVAADLRTLPFRSGSLDLVFSNSSLDHFETREEFEAALQEIARVLSPGGRLVLTLDNCWNPLYWPLRWLGKTRFAPFPMGYSPSPRRLQQVLRQTGLVVSRTGVMIHNPRLLSTALFLLLRRLLGAQAHAPIRILLAAFEALHHLPTRRFSACFVTVHATQPTPRATPAAP
jgi:SAM-dependent methyltransferase